MCEPCGAQVKHAVSRVCRVATEREVIVATATLGRKFRHFDQCRDLAADWSRARPCSAAKGSKARHQHRLHLGSPAMSSHAQDMSRLVSTKVVQVVIAAGVAPVPFFLLIDRLRRKRGPPREPMLGSSLMLICGTRFGRLCPCSPLTMSQCVRARSIAGHTGVACSGGARSGGSAPRQGTQCS